jgi:hypothetical protein
MGEAFGVMGKNKKAYEVLVAKLEDRLDDPIVDVMMTLK